MRSRSIVVALVAAGVCLAANKDDDKGPVPTFESDGYSLACNELESRSRVELAERGDREHTLELRATVTVPDNEDVAALTEKLKVIEAADTAGGDLLKIDPRKPAPAHRKRAEFVPVIDRRAEVQIDRLALAVNPYMVRSMTAEAQAVIVSDRDSRRLPAAVMETPVELVPGLAARVESVKIGAKRDFTIVVRFARDAEGTVGAFIDQIFILDEDAGKLGGGRWTEGNPFAKAGTLTLRGDLAGGASIKYIRLMAATKYELKTVRFRIRDIFQN